MVAMHLLLIASAFGALSVMLSGCGGGGKTTTSTTPHGPPTPPPTPIPDLEKRQKCSDLFGACGQLPDADECYVASSISAAKFAKCDGQLPKVVNDFTSKAYSMDSQQEYILAGLAGGLLQKPTCATAMRYLNFSNGQCPMPLPPRQKDLTAGDTFSIFAIGDWGPTPLGFTAKGPNTCDCGNGASCHASVYEHVANYHDEGLACQHEGAHQVKHTDAQQAVSDSMALWAQDEQPVAVMNVNGSCMGKSGKALLGSQKKCRDEIGVPPM